MIFVLPASKMRLQVINGYRFDTAQKSQRSYSNLDKLLSFGSVRKNNLFSKQSRLRSCIDGVLKEKETAVIPCPCDRREKTEERSQLWSHQFFISVESWKTPRGSSYLSCPLFLIGFRNCTPGPLDPTAVRGKKLASRQKLSVPLPDKFFHLKVYTQFCTSAGRIWESS